MIINFFQDMIDKIFNLFLYYFSNDFETEIRVRSLQGLGQLFIRFPKLLSNSDQLITSSLLSSSDDRIKIQILKIFTDLIIEEEKIIKWKSKEEKNNLKETNEDLNKRFFFFNFKNF